MIIGDNKKEVINNIKIAADNKEFNKKVEVNDPKLSTEQKRKIIEKYLKTRNGLGYKFNNEIARLVVDFVTWSQNKDTEIVGLENIENINSGAIITSNHFNPIDNTIIRKLVKKIGKNNLYIVGQEANFAMPGMVGYMMNFSDIIPISNQVSYLRNEFQDLIEEKLNKNNFILIYPEEEMWFNYRKPRTLKRGAYYYATKCNVPIISCFVEIIDTEEKDNDEFYKVKYRLHVLPTIYPDPNKTMRENTKYMMEKDYEQKKQAYEKAYKKELDYEFEDDDIAGLIRK